MSEERITNMVYRHFIENINDYAIYMLDIKGVVSSWNEGAKIIKGYTKEEIIDQYFGVFYSEAEQNTGVPAENLETALYNGKYIGEGLRFRKDGSNFWAYVVIDAIKDENGNLLGFSKVTRDISEQKKVSIRYHGWHVMIC